ncbi:hypothetical protein EYF80_037432 [Liparis tanakae]|uniref:Uncharacterized protein n=1 Tax=Liparis tanakae TaxID=230148 RepID=A0A4Z2GG16_9TELE|nr:hypothetical protein EYF80_037432 [Liparis tanakae]
MKITILPLSAAFGWSSLDPAPLSKLSNLSERSLRWERNWVLPAASRPRSVSTWNSCVPLVIFSSSLFPTKSLHRNFMSSSCVWASWLEMSSSTLWNCKPLMSSRTRRSEPFPFPSSSSSSSARTRKHLAFTFTSARRVVFGAVSLDISNNDGIDKFSPSQNTACVACVGGRQWGCAGLRLADEGVVQLSWLWLSRAASLLPCSSCMKSSTMRIFSLWIWRLMSLGMSGINQSTKSLISITTFCTGDREQIGTPLKRTRC